MALITRKLIKITSRGRYVYSTGKAVIGPQIAFCYEQVDAIKDLLKKYPNIKIVEKLENGMTANLTLANYDKDNNVKSGPISMEEPPKDGDPTSNPDDSNPDNGEGGTDDGEKEPDNNGNPTTDKGGEPNNNGTDTSDQTPDEEPSDSIPEGVTQPENGDDNGGKADETNDPAPENPESNSAPEVTEGDNSDSDKVPEQVEETKEVQPQQQTGQSSKKNKKGKQQQGNKSTDVVPEEA